MSVMKSLFNHINSPQLAHLVIGAKLPILLMRLFSFIAHDPLLAYGKNYDMIRLQACHQIWPLAQDKIERYHRSMKNVVKLENY